MKNTKRLYYVILLVASAAFIGCQREDLHVMIPDNDVKEIYVTTEDMSSTKTYMDGTDVLWSSGDRIAVFYKNTLRKRFDVTDESIGGKDATFQLDENYIITGSNVSISNNVAYYPFCNLNCAADGSSYILDCQ